MWVLCSGEVWLTFTRERTYVYCASPFADRLVARRRLADAVDQKLSGRCGKQWMFVC